MPAGIGRRGLTFRHFGVADDVMASANTRSTLTRHLSPLAGSFWIFFLVVTALVAPIWALDLGEAQIRESITNPELQTALLWLSDVVDVAWMTLAAITVYSSVARTTGLTRARQWAMLVLGGSWLTGALSVWTSWPLGTIHFTSRFGPLLGPVSLGWLVLWCVVIFGARDTALAVSPRASHTQVSLVTALFAALTDLNLEPLASKTRAWWLWMERTSGPLPEAVQSSLVWFLATLAFAWCFRTPIVTKAETTRLPKSAQVFLALNLLLLLAHIGNAFRQ